MKKKIIRVFVSSTFTDFTEERARLNNRIFPVIEKLCAERDFSFQAVDLRYGISQVVADEQGAMSICLEEIDRCKATGNYPYFLLLLGERCGWVPIPESFEVEDYDLIYEYLKQKGQKHRLASLEEYYRLDENSVPARYVLLEKQDDWEMDELMLSKTFADISQNKILSSEKNDYYFGSATGREIVKGIFEADSDADIKNIICIDRSLQISDLDRLFDSEQQKRQYQSGLREKVKEKLIENGNYISIRYPANMSEADSADREAYYSEFDRTVEETLRRIVEKTIDAYYAENIDEEAELQKNFLEHSLRSVYGRTKEISAGLEYAFSDSNRIFAYNGAGGFGKTTVMAMLINQLQAKCEAAKTVCVYKFAGISTKSTEISAFVKELDFRLCNSIDSLTYDEKKNYGEACTNFLFHLENIPEDIRVIFCIDALDQLVSFSGEPLLQWLPEKCRKNVKFILSVSDDMNTGKGSLASIFGEAELCPVGRLETDLVEPIVNGMLSQLGRRINPDQMELVKQHYEKEGNPFFISLIFSKLRELRSFDTTLSICDSSHDEINAFVEKCEHEFGREMISGIFCLLMVSCYGLTEKELLEMLSDSESIRAEYALIYRESPKIAVGESIPFMVWSRIFFTISDFLKSINNEGRTLLDFYHREVEEIISDRYFSKGDEQKYRRQIIEYFCKEPAFFLDEATEKIVNNRKITELSYQYTCLHDYRGLKKLLSDGKYIKARLSNYELKNLIDEEQMVLLNCEMSETEGNELINILVREIIRFVADRDRDFAATVFEDIHTLTVNRRNVKIHDWFFDETDVDDIIRIFDEIGYEDSNRNEAAAWLNMTCRLRIANRYRRYGKIDEAIAYINEVETIILSYIEKNDATKRDYAEYARLKYDKAFLFYLLDDRMSFEKEMTDSVIYSEMADNEVGETISRTVRGYNMMILSMGTPELADRAKKVLETDFGKNPVDEKTGKPVESSFSVFLKHSSTNVGAKRWITNTLMGHRMEAAFFAGDFEGIRTLYYAERAKFAGDAAPTRDKGLYDAMYEIACGRPEKAVALIMSCIIPGCDETGTQDVAAFVSPETMEELYIFDQVKSHHDQFSRYYYLLAYALKATGRMDDYRIIVRGYIENAGRAEYIRNVQYYGRMIENMYKEL